MVKMLTRLKPAEHPEVRQDDQQVKNYWKNYRWEGVSLDKNKAELFPLLMKYLPKGGPIIEAGCGSGRWLPLLKSEGFKLVGVDINEQALSACKLRFPTLSLCTGDVTKLPFKDGTFQACLSFGVVEHFIEGPYGPLAEAYRVLKNNAIMILTVPYFSLWRQLLEGFRKSLGYTQEGAFFEYQFTKEEILEALRKTGFEVITYKRVGLFMGLHDFSLFRYIASKTYYPLKNTGDVVFQEGGKQHRFLDLSRLPHTIFYRLGWLCPHMIVVVARKETKK